MVLYPSRNAPDTGAGRSPLCWRAVSEAEEAYNPAEAARVLGVSDRRVRQLLEAGDLEGGQDASGRWKTPRRAVHAMLEARGSPRGSSAKLARRIGATASGAGGATDEDLRELVSRVEDLSYRLGASQTRLELSERAESSIREERDRLLRELEEERAERRRLAERLESVEGRQEEPGEAGPATAAEIPAATTGEASDQPRLPPWWKRIFR